MGRQDQGAGAASRPRREEFSAEDLADGPEVPVERLEARARELLETIQNPQLRELLDRFFAPGLADLGALPRRAGRQVLPPGLPPRAARPHASRSPRPSAPRPPPSRASTATSRSPARCCTTSARPRPTTTTRWRSTSPTPAASRARSRSATTWCAARSSRSRASTPALAQAILHIVLSHHGTLENGSPVVPATREATARPRDRQPRRQARQLRPDRARAARRRGLVALRPRL